MRTVYPAIFTPTGDQKDTYLVDIPDLDRVTEGYGLADAIRMARDLIGCVLYDLEESQYPKASKSDEIDVRSGKFADVAQGTVSIVDIDMDIYRQKMDNQPVRRNVSLPSWLNKKANDAHINVSRVLQEALIERLGAV